MKEAFEKTEGLTDQESFSVWRKRKSDMYPTFKFWDLVERLETLALIFCRAHRQKKFFLYIEALEELIPFFFAMNHTNYSRWASVHVRDMKSLPESIQKEFVDRGNWVISKSQRKFSAIPIDQAHEQENKLVKGSGGVIGITNSPSSLRRWMLSGPQISRMVEEFQDQYLDDDQELEQRHHEQDLPTQTTFQRQVVSLTETMRRMGNPFEDDYQELVSLNSRICIDGSAVEDIYKLEPTGKEQYLRFVKTVFEERSNSIHEPIKKNSFKLFKSKPQNTSKQGKKVKTLQNNVALFGQLYVAMQSRDGNLEEFFAHEIQSFPPSLSDYGKLHLPSKKSDLLECINPSQDEESPVQFDCKILDGAVTVHSLPTSAVTTFDDYADKIFIPYMKTLLQTASRIDVVWDRYVQDSLKESTREKRCKGIRRKVSGATKLPTKWMDFLRDPLNKSELFSFLSDKIKATTWAAEKLVFVTEGTAVASIGTTDTMGQCSHEEADTRIIVHLIHALKLGGRRIQVRTVDTDVVVILIGVFLDIAATYPTADVWVAFGMGNNHKLFHINTICETLGEQRSKSLPIFHAFSGCDTTSSFNGKGKKSAWQAWNVFPEITDTFVHLADYPFHNVDNDNFHF